MHIVQRHRFLLVGLAFAGFFLIFGFPSGVEAQAVIDEARGPLETFRARTALPKTDVAGTVGWVIQTMLSLGGLFFFVLMIYAAIRWMTARGEEDQISAAQRTFSGAVIGLVIMVASYATTLLITQTLIPGGSGDGASGSVMTEDGEAVLGCCLLQVRRTDELITDARWSASMKLKEACDTFTAAPNTEILNRRWVDNQDASQCHPRLAR